MDKTYSTYNLKNRFEPEKTDEDMLKILTAKMDLAPSDFVIRNILNYSKALEMLKTAATGNVGLILN
ncbi:MAG: hypothetical protein K9J13_15470 [Saprospiraceae bacterium]|nr:hypothetical protein [Saprospiraceae bacterium]